MLGNYSFLLIIVNLFFTPQITLEANVKYMQNDAKQALPPVNWFTDQIFEKYSAINNTIKIQGNSIGTIPKSFVELLKY